MMENFLENVYEYFINLMSEKQVKPVPIDLFEEDIKQLEMNGLEDVAEIRESGKSGELVLNKSAIKGEYRYYIDQGTTMQKDDQDELDALVNIGKFMIETGLAQATQMDMREYAKKIFIKSGVSDWEKILPEVSEGMVDPATGQPVDPAQQQQQPQVDPNQVIAQMQARDAEVQALAQAALGGTNV